MTREQRTRRTSERTLRSAPPLVPEPNRTEEAIERTEESSEEKAIQKGEGRVRVRRTARV